MHKKKRDLSWSDLYASWKMISEILDSPALEEAQFLQIQTPYVPGYVFDTPVDWWPRCQIQERIAFYARPTYMNPYATKAGTVHTAKLLWHAHDNLELQHVIYILASLRDRDKDIPESWRGEPFMVNRDVWQVARQQLPDNLSYWHHASKNALPVHLLDAYRNASKMIVPEEPDDLMFIAAVEASLSVANWQLIEFIQEPSKSFRVVK